MRQIKRMKKRWAHQIIRGLTLGMAKKRSRLQKTDTGTATGARARFMAIGLLLSLVLAVGVLARWPTLFTPHKLQKDSKAAMSPASLVAGSPTKEYVYAGARLVATEGCATLSPLSQSFPAINSSGNAFTASVTVTAAGDCSWTAIVTSGSNFITITSGSSGSGSGTVAYQVSNNNLSGSGRRTGTITIAGQAFTVYQGANFTDIAANDFFYPYIGRLSARGFTSGCTASTFCPNDSVYRDQMAVFLERCMGVFNPPTPPPGQQTFTDVPTTYWAYTFIEDFAKRGITSGCGGGNYCPGGQVTREQIATFLERAAGRPNPPAPPSQRFTDVPPSSPFYAFIESFYMNGYNADHNMNAVINDSNCSTSGNFCPGQPITRAEMAAFMVIIFGL